MCSGPCRQAFQHRIKCLTAMLAVQALAWGIFAAWHTDRFISAAVVWSWAAVCSNGRHPCRSLCRLAKSAVMSCSSLRPQCVHPALPAAAVCRRAETNAAGKFAIFAQANLFGRETLSWWQSRLLPSHEVSMTMRSFWACDLLAPKPLVPFANLGANDSQSCCKLHQLLLVFDNV